MHINVSHILAGEVGDSANFAITGESPTIPDVQLVTPITGSITIIRLDDGLAASGQAQLAFKLECYRCLDGYEHEMELALKGMFMDKPDEEEWPISNRGEIDIAPMIRQEALLRIPIQQLCRDDCAGLCDTCGQKRQDGHTHQTTEPHNRPRIKKGQ